MRVGRVELGPGAIILIVLVMAGLVYVGLDKLGVISKLREGMQLPATGVSLVPDKPMDIAEDLKNVSFGPSEIAPPQKTTDNPEVAIGIWTWQTQSGLIDAVGGPGKSGDHSDSCLCQAGITNTRLVLQNDTSMQIQALAAGQMQLVTTTGDQAAVDITGANKLLRGNKAKIIWSGGYSFGEDCLMGPESWKQDPQAARGAVIVTAVPYCDWNVVVDWAGDNQIPVNSDESAYDPDAINFVNATDHIEAAQKFVQNAKVSLRNRKTGQMEEHTITGVGTWTPGDVMAVQGRPTVEYEGKVEKLQKIVSTKEYSYMMPNLLFGNADWLSQHRDYVKTLLRCIARSNEKIKSDPEYFKNRVAALNALVFNMEGKGPSFWHKYFYGAAENGVPLGGSRVNNIKEVRHLFGIDQNLPIEKSVFGITYLDHARRLQKLIPDRLPSYTPVAEAVDLSFIREISDEEAGTSVYQAKFEDRPTTGTVVKASYQIRFATGSAKIMPSEEPVLQEIRSLLVRASDTKVVLEGHTDNTGDVATNLALSKQRAESVWQWLKASDPTRVNISDRRLEAIEGYGPYRPLPGNTNKDEAERAANRRVVIILK
ncbi:MAG: OmpA family protein [Acidobacteriota bacterium]|nr:OmpA family protein [Blastocatellia bacterium]MDW8411185.1 OmpA family protein [Acidobacteriota bacterium]